MTDLTDKIITGSETILKPLEMTLFTIGGSEISTFDILEFVLVFLVAYWLGKISESSIKRIGNRHGSVRPESLSMLARFVHWSIIGIGILIGLSMIGLPITHLAILVSALSVGIGFGLQTIVNNSVAGLILISERAVSLGDIIGTPDGKVGRVTMITIRATRIVTPTGEDIIIPNASLINKSFTNYTMDRRGVRKIFPFSIPYGIDFRKVKEIIEKAAVSVPYCIKPDELHEVECGITGFGNFGINVELVVWVDPVELMEPYRLEAAFLNAINDACVANGIVMPGPSYGVTVSPTPTPVGFSAQVSGSTSTVPANLQAPAASSKIPPADPNASAKAIGAPAISPAAAASIIGYPQTSIENASKPKEEGESEKKESDDEDEESSGGFFFKKK
ncbi:mechanosensitive ion channel family protein [uncultured Parasutterella sp.]|uniref:mechanosensitive ion channel family protein n=1 Tax=uncultured Parasutterella sp. TaxID=1263098 RepID=UPI00259737A6|nr:mechanosensitive ion channel domain-containing protein [uncultured Parasutterella sp.]